MCTTHSFATLPQLAGYRRSTRTSTALSKLSAVSLQVDRRATHPQRRLLITVISPGKSGKTLRMVPDWSG